MNSWNLHAVLDHDLELNQAMDISARINTPRPQGVRALLWFRTDLRLHDNPALQAVLKLRPEVLYPVSLKPHLIWHGQKD